MADRGVTIMRWTVVIDRAGKVAATCGRVARSVLRSTRFMSGWASRLCARRARWIALSSTHAAPPFPHRIECILVPVAIGDPAQEEGGAIVAKEFGRHAGVVARPIAGEDPGFDADSSLGIGAVQHVFPVPGGQKQVPGNAVQGGMQVQCAGRADPGNVFPNRGPVIACGGGKIGSKSGDEYVCFGLGE